MKTSKIIIIMFLTICSACLAPLDTTKVNEAGIYDELKDWPSGFSDTLIASWEDDKMAAFSITIDDNHGQDVEWWITKGDEYDIKFTWFLIAKIIKDDVTPYPPGYWYLYRKAFEHGHDLQSHTYSHNDGADMGTMTINQEYSEAISTIETKVPGAKVETLAYPGGYKATDPTEKDDLDIAMQYYIGARGVVNNINHKSFDYTNCLAISQVADIQNKDTKWVYAPRLFDPNDESFRGFFCMYFHDVYYVNEAQKKAAAIKVLEFCKSMKNELWVTSFRNVIKYARERDAVNACGGISSSSTRSSITISLTTGDRLDLRFDYPLTLKVKVDSGWQHATASQDGNTLPVKCNIYNSEYYLLIQAVPDAGKILIAKPN